MNKAATRNRTDLIPSLALVFGAMGWGLFWLPVRGIEAAGIGPAWSGVLIFGSTLVVFLPFMLFRVRQLLSGGMDLFWAGVFSGLAFALYTISINMTDVVRVILLFYMSPLWSTILGVIVLKERLTINRLIALLLGFAGLLVVLGAGYRFPIPENLGDWFALTSGLLWSIASVRLFQGGPTILVEKVFVFIYFGLAFSLILAALPLGFDKSVPHFDQLLASGKWLLIIALLMLPMNYLIIWPASVLSPGRVGMLLMGEVVAGVASAAWLTDETFGLRELIGTLLLVAAAFVEVIRQSSISQRKDLPNPVAATVKPLE